MTTRPPFPLLWDSSMLSTLRSCKQKFFREYVEHWKPLTLSVHLHAGKAYARGLEVARKAYYSNGASPDAALEAGLAALMEAYGDFECPPDSTKSLTRMLGALEFYFSQYPFETDPVQPLLVNGAPAIEFSFAVPFPVRHPESGEPIIFCGRADMLATFAGAPYVFDDKTTSQLGASWAGQWALRGQFSGYGWAAYETGIDTDGTLIRGVSILKAKYETQQALSPRPRWMIDRWLAQSIYDIEAAISAWKSGWWDYNLDETCNHYGGCMFKRICTSQEPDPWLANYFEQRVWNPLTREETPLPKAAP